MSLLAGAVAMLAPRPAAGPTLAFLQLLLGPPNAALADATFWPRLAGGCHLARDTGTVIEQAGFQIETFERFRFSPAAFLPADPHILGVARRRA